MTHLLQSYLFAWLFWLGVALGSFAILAIHALTGGKWGEAIRAPLLAATGTIPLFAILMLPLLVGMKLLFPWSGAASDVRAAYLNVPFFVVRAAIYFFCWTALSLATLRRRAVPLAGPNLLLYVVTMTFASWDWMMSLEPKWWSTVYAMNVLTAQALSALAAILVIVIVFRMCDERVFPDLGNLLLTMLMFEAYLTFSQFLVIWSGNEKAKIAWYLSRTETSWQWLAAALIVFAFFAPFLALLFRAAKRSPRVLGAIAGALLLMQAVALFWTVAPAFHPAGVSAWSIVDVVMLAVVGFVWLRVFRWQLRSHAIAATASAERV